jgi:glycosyltransferase involved in cell wall biosynthesis
MSTASTPNQNPEIELTFILPTRNRRLWVSRAIESCLRCHQPGVGVEVLVLDDSNDGSSEELQRLYGADPRVRLMRSATPGGFMKTCLWAIPQVRTPFATFMYDDDVLSPYWADLARELSRRKAGFVMGFGERSPVTEVLEFRRVEQLKIVTPSLLLQAYCGRGRLLSRHGLPCSPICCLTRTAVLEEWVKELERFVQGRPLREYFVMQRAAGPDQLIYYLSITRHEGEIAIFDGPVAQFSAHDESITSQFEATDIVIGYWLAQLWACNWLLRHGASTDAGWCAAYTVREGIRLLIKRLSRRRWKWSGGFARELASLLGRTLASRAGAAFMVSFALLLLPRRIRPQPEFPVKSETLA